MVRETSAEEFKAYLKRVNEALKPHGIKVSAPRGETENARLLVAWEATVRLLAKLGGVTLYREKFALGYLEPGDIPYSVEKARGMTTDDDESLFILNPDSVIVPANKASVMSILMMRRAAEALSQMFLLEEVMGAREEMEEKAAFEIDTLIAIFKAYRLKKVHPEYKLHWEMNQ